MPAISLEANACGLPVVTVNHRKNAACDFINGENGFVCELSAEDIAEKVIIGLKMGKIMRRKCVENAMKYDWNRITTFIEEYYEQILGKCRGDSL